jgi:DNA-binding LacI/PurR family transcriptional regulator
VDPRIELLESAAMPFVTLGRSTSGGGYPWIDLDFEGVASAAVARLVAKGHRRIAVTVPFGTINFGPVFEQAYRDALPEHGLAFDPDLVLVTKRDEQAGYELVDRLMSIPNPPTAVILIYEIVAIGIYRRLAELGRRPGKDLAIIGFRDEPTVRFLSPSLTCFHASLHEIGEDLGAALLSRIPSYAAAISSAPTAKRAPMTLQPGESD